MIYSTYRIMGKFGDQNIWQFTDKRHLVGIKLAITVKEHHSMNHMHVFGSIKTKLPIHQTKTIFLPLCGRSCEMKVPIVRERKLTRKLTKRMDMMTMKMTQMKKATAGKGSSSLVPLPSFSYLKMVSSGPPLVITISLMKARAGLRNGDAYSVCVCVCSCAC